MLWNIKWLINNNSKLIKRKILNAVIWEILGHPHFYPRERAFSFGTSVNNLLFQWGELHFKWCRQNIGQHTKGEKQTERGNRGARHILPRDCTVNSENYGCTYTWLVSFQYKVTSECGRMWYKNRIWRHTEENLLNLGQATKNSTKPEYRWVS